MGGDGVGHVLMTILYLPLVVYAYVLVLAFRELCTHQARRLKVRALKLQVSPAPAPLWFLASVRAIAG